jgi:ectoine hydroxylase-related dioxygenase (phytanoyl-CoA dioxygenase family)
MVHYRALSRQIYDFSRLGLQPSLSTMWAIDEFTPENGATNVVKGSRHWAPERRPQREEALSAAMQRGSVLVFASDCWHGAGKNITPDVTRVGLNASYSLSWLAQEENQFLAIPPKTAESIPRALLELAGFSCPSGSLGYVCGGRNPVDAAQGLGRVPSGWDWAQPLASQPAATWIAPGDIRCLARL